MTLLDARNFACPECTHPFYYGWEDLESLREFLLTGWTYNAMNGPSRFEWVKCAECKGKFKISGLGI